MLKGSSDILHAVDANLKVVGPEAEEDDNVRHISFDKNRFGLAGELTVLMTEKGYDFEVDIESTTEDNSTKSTNNRAQLWAKVLDLEGDITIQKVMPIVGGNVASAMTLLREMCLNQMIIKEGRGNKAQYERTK